MYSISASYKIFASVLLFAISFFIKSLNATIISGHISIRESWFFLAKFCFLPDKGRFNLDITIPSFSAGVNLLFYYDDQWPSWIEPTQNVCLERDLILSRRVGKVFSLSSSDPLCDTKSNGDLECKGSTQFQSIRPRWLYFVLSNCDTSNPGLNASYWISLTNDEPGSFWRRHFSADEFYTLPILMVALCVYFIFTIYSVYFALHLRSRKILPDTYQVYIASLILHLVGLLLQVSSSIFRATTGEDLAWALSVGNTLEVASEVAFAVNLALMSQGYVDFRKTSNRCRIILVVLAILYVRIFSRNSLYVYGSVPTSSQYNAWETPEGHILLVSKVTLWIVFACLCFRTNRKYSSNFQLYKMFALGSVWFLLQPLLVLIVILTAAKWSSESTAKCVTLWSIFASDLVYLYLVRPWSDKSTNFPLYSKTSQVSPTPTAPQKSEIDSNTTRAP